MPRVGNSPSAGSVLYEGITWAGYVGILTGMKAGYVSISVDQVCTLLLLLIVLVFV